MRRLRRLQTCVRTLRKPTHRRSSRGRAHCRNAVQSGSCMSSRTLDMSGEGLRFDPSTPKHPAECDLRQRLIRPGLVKEAELTSVGKSADVGIIAHSLECLPAPWAAAVGGKTTLWRILGAVSGAGKRARYKVLHFATHEPAVRRERGETQCQNRMGAKYTRPPQGGPDLVSRAPSVQVEHKGKSAAGCRGLAPRGRISLLFSRGFA